MNPPSDEHRSRTTRIWPLGIVLALTGAGAVAWLSVIAATSWGPPSVGYDVYDPPAGAWKDVRGTRGRWREGLSGMVCIHDRRDPWSKERCFILEGSSIVNADSQEGGTGTRMHRENVEPSRPSPPLEDLASFATCAVTRVPLVPADHVSVKLEVEITSDGAIASLSPEGKVFRGLQECADAAAASYREKDDQPGTIEISFGFSYAAWCEELPTGQKLDPPEGWLSAGGSKGGTYWVLQPAPFGYWFLWCSRAEAWQVQVTEGTVEIVSQPGVVLSRARRTEQGFSVADPAGNVMLSATGPRDRLDLFVAGKPVGQLLSTSRAGQPPVIELRVPKHEPVVVQGQERRWFLDHDFGTLSLDRRAVPDALPLLAIGDSQGFPKTIPHWRGFDLAFQHEVAAFAALSNWPE